MGNFNMVLDKVREYNNQGDYAKAMEALNGMGDELAANPYLSFHYGFALHECHMEHKAVEYFKKAKEMGLEEIDELPNTFYPKSVTKWIERAERKAPRRLEKNAFESGRRAKRNPAPKDSSLADFDYEEFWNDCDYSLEEYVGRVPTDTDIAETEAELGYRLPSSYKALIKQHNGGLLTKNCFENPLQRDWSPEAFSVESIFGIDREKPYSLCGETGSRFWIAEWGYPDIGIAICDTMTGGHDLIFLDYSDCGPKGEPCVVHIDQESNYEITYLADSFEDFVRGLTAEEEDF